LSSCKQIKVVVVAGCANCPCYYTTCYTGVDKDICCLLEREISPGTETDPACPLREKHVLLQLLERPDPPAQMAGLMPDSFEEE